MKGVVQRILDQAGPLPDDLNRYFEAALSENARLLKIGKEE